MPIEFKGKTYYLVHERLLEMIKESGSKYDLTTEIINMEKGRWVVKATLKINRGIYTGHACEIDNSNFINKTSALENAETSAIGRALASAGYCDGSFCSADELANAILNKTIENINYIENENNSNKEEKSTSEAQINLIKRLITISKISKEEENKWLQKGKISAWDEATSKQANSVIDFLNKKIKEEKSKNSLQFGKDSYTEQEIKYGQETQHDDSGQQQISDETQYDDSF